MKECTLCKESKELLEFNKNKRTKDGHSNVCRLCSNAESKKYYELNKDKHKEMVKIRRNNIVAENRLKLYEYLKINHCIDCGESNPIVLDLDHRDGVEKRSCISEMMQLSWNTIEEELIKCDVRCANCHRIRTAEQQGWYKWLNS